MKGLTVGRMVHYVLVGGRHAPAVINQVVSKEFGDVGMTVFMPASLCSTGKQTTWPVVAPYSETPDEGTWHWIERED